MINADNAAHPNSRDPDIDSLQAQLQHRCDEEGRNERIAYARSSFDQAIYWLRSHRDHQRQIAGVK